MRGDAGIVDHNPVHHDVLAVDHGDISHAVAVSEIGRGFEVYDRSLGGSQQSQFASQALFGGQGLASHRYLSDFSQRASVTLLPSGRKAGEIRDVERTHRCLRQFRGGSEAGRLVQEP